jgi:hypothetical protein
MHSDIHAAQRLTDIHADVAVGPELPALQAKLAGLQKASGGDVGCNFFPSPGQQLQFSKLVLI